MRLILALLVVASMSGCASYRNRPPQPDGHYWQINKPAPQPVEPKTAVQGDANHV